MTVDTYLNLVSVNITTLTGAAFCIFVTSLLSYVIYAFSIREKSFEEVIEEQRRREQEELQQKAEKLKKEREREKKHKKWTKKAKDRNDQVTETVKDEVIQEGQNAMELNNDIEIVEPVKKKTKSSLKQNNISSAPQSSKVTNTNEKSVKEAPDSPNSNVEEKEKEVTKEEKSVGKEMNKKEKASLNKEEKKPKSDVAAKEKERKENQKDTESQSPQSTQTETLQPEVAVSNTTNKKKKKSDHSEKDDHIPMTAYKLISLIKETPLEEDDSQMLINALLNKQKEASGWKKTGDNQNVKKQKDVVNNQEQRHKQTSVKPQEIGLATKLVSNDKLEAQQKEIFALTARIKQTEEELLQERKVIEMKMTEFEKTKSENASNAATIKKLEEEKQQLMKNVKRLEFESKSADATAEFEKLKKTKDDLQKVHSLLVEQHTQMHTANISETKKLNAQLDEVTKALEKARLEKDKFSNEINGWKNKFEKAEAQKTKAEQELQTLKQSSSKEVKHLKTRLEGLDKEMKDLQEHLAELTHSKNELAAEMANLRDENERLSAELAATNERVSGDGQEVQQNGEVNGKPMEDQNLIVEKDKSLLEKEDAIKKLQAEIENLNKEIEQQKQKNNELREKNWKAMEAMKSAEKTAEDKIKEAERISNEKLKDVDKQLKVTVEETEKAKQKIHELEKQLKIPSVQSESTERVKELSERLSQTEGQLTTLREEYSNYQKKNESTLSENNRLNGEIQKVQQAEKTLSNTVKTNETLINDLKLSLQNLENNSKASLQRLFPSVQLPESLSFKEWLVQFETHIKDERHRISNAESQIDELRVQLTEITKLRDDKEKELKKHITMLGETETMLKNLSDSAKASEAEYIQKLKAKDEQLEKALNELAAVEKLKEELSSNIKKLDQLREEHTTLQSSFESSQSKVKELEQRYEEVNNNYLNLQSQFDMKDQQISKLQEEIVLLDKLRKELDDLKSKLDKEKEINKNFNTQMVKLNSLVKIGQDALQQEQEQVKKLQSQLSEKLATTNGTSSPPTIPEDAAGKK